MPEHLERKFNTVLSSAADYEQVLKDFLHYQDTQAIFGARDATRKAFAVGLIE